MATSQKKTEVSETNTGKNRKNQKTFNKIPKNAPRATVITAAGPAYIIFQTGFLRYFR